jgi:4-hydroxythreonine-4-phosphate dehydrogenase
MGDPAGCGPQITIKAWKNASASGSKPFCVIGDPRLYQSDIPVCSITEIAEAESVFATALPVLPLEIEDFEHIQHGQPSSAGAGATIDAIQRATALCLTGEAAGMVTNPISKAVLYSAGFSHPGHTEFIADLCSAHSNHSILPVMMLVGGGLRVSLATIHVPLREVAKHLSPSSLTQIAKTTNTALRRDFGIQAPRIAFTGLNPHAGENGSIGTEEVDLINPIAAHLRAEGVDITDARSADTVFHEALSGQFDAVIAMTHDQGLIPVKTLDMWGGVNTTLGLPIIRTSPDHGTAYDAARAGTARPDSLVAAINLAHKMISNRDAYDG